VTGEAHRFQLRLAHEVQPSDIAYYAIVVCTWGEFMLPLGRVFLLKQCARAGPQCSAEIETCVFSAFAASRSCTVGAGGGPWPPAGPVPGGTHSACGHQHTM
jgi:hypothetical protein